MGGSFDIIFKIIFLMYFVNINIHSELMAYIIKMPNVVLTLTMT